MPEDHTLVRLETLALVGVGGFAGSNLRFFATDAFADLWGILLVNVLGSAVLGFLVHEAQYSGVVDRKARLLVTTGFLSSLTTYSGFAVQTATAGGPALVGGFVAGNYALGFAGVVLGRVAAQWVRGDRS